MKFAALTTDRLLLRPWTTDDDDVDFLFDMYSRWEVQQYIGREPSVLTDRREAALRAERWVDAESGIPGLPGVLAITDRAAGDRFGSVLLKSLPASGAAEPLSPSGETEVGWHLHPSSWGHGYASEAASRMLAEAWRGGLERVLAVTHPDNVASQAVARRIGMRDRGLTDAFYNTTCALFEVDRPGG
jgi:RimJ/RimL family protein N-acetyltransferase